MRTIRRSRLFEKVAYLKVNSVKFRFVVVVVNDLPDVVICVVVAAVDSTTVKAVTVKVDTVKVVTVKVVSVKVVIVKVVAPVTFLF